MTARAMLTATAAPSAIQASRSVEGAPASEWKRDGLPGRSECVVIRSPVAGQSSAACRGSRSSAPRSPSSRLGRPDVDERLDLEAVASLLLVPKIQWQARE